MMEQTISLRDLIAPSFYDLHRDIKAGGHTHYWLKGGRGSTKSSFVALEIVFNLMKDANRGEKNCAIAFRFIGSNLRDSVFSQIGWAIDVLGVNHLWKKHISPLAYIYIPTGSEIIFRGVDDPTKIKSIKARVGRFKYIWFEEVNEFSSSAEIRSVLQSAMRGDGDFVVFYSFNPPKSRAAWTYKECLIEQPSKVVHHSTYLTVPEQWLGPAFLAEAEQLKEISEALYNHEYMGEATGTGGEIFNNLVIRRITDEEIKGFKNIRRGLDWGYADPLHYGVQAYDKEFRRLYVFFEIHETRMSQDRIAELIRAENKENKPIMTDSSSESNKRSNEDFAARGINIIPATKGRGSVDFGIKFLQDLAEIVIDPFRCPEATKEFSEYEYPRDRFGSIIAEYPDTNNHGIDQCRYALQYDMRNTKII